MGRRYKLVELQGAQHGRVHYLQDGQEMYIGSRPDCSVVIMAEGIQPIHCRLYWYEGHLFVRSWESALVKLDSKQVVKRPRQLQAGQIIQLADNVLLRVEEFAETDEPHIPHLMILDGPYRQKTSSTGKTGPDNVVICW